MGDWNDKRRLDQIKIDIKTTSYRQDIISQMLLRDTIGLGTITITDLATCN